MHSLTSVTSCPGEGPPTTLQLPFLWTVHLADFHVQSTPSRSNHARTHLYHVRAKVHLAGVIFLGQKRDDGLGQRHLHRGGAQQ